MGLQFSSSCVHETSTVIEQNIQERVLIKPNSDKIQAQKGKKLRKKRFFPFSTRSITTDFVQDDNDDLKSEITAIETTFDERSTGFLTPMNSIIPNFEIQQPQIPLNITPEFYIGWEIFVDQQGVGNIRKFVNKCKDGLIFIVQVKYISYLLSCFY
jgi:hypothetical protein